MPERGVSRKSRPRAVGLVFTRYPVCTETFLQREVDVLRQSVPDWEVLSMWGRGAPGRRPDFQFRLKHLWRLLWLLPYWLIRRPRGMVSLAEPLVYGRIPTMINFCENLLGLGVALCWAGTWARRYGHLHAVWATGSGTVVWAVNRLTGVPYSLSGHAYDLFEGGGDGWIAWKVRDAAFVRSSTAEGVRRWEQLGVEPGHIHLIRRGLGELPEVGHRDRPGLPYRLLSVGRMVEKMGHEQLCRILHELKRMQVPFVAKLVGAGPLRGQIEARLRQTGLEGSVELTGALPYEEVEACYAAADLFLFTGVVARSGDRAGFPNALAEAMAWGVPVAATPVGGVPEVIRAGANGILLDADAGRAAGQVAALLADPGQCERFRRAGRQWIEDNFRASVNLRALIRLVEESH